MAPFDQVVMHSRIVTDDSVDRVETTTTALDHNDHCCALEQAYHETNDNAVATYLSLIAWVLCT